MRYLLHLLIVLVCIVSAQGVTSFMLEDQSQAVAKTATTPMKAQGRTRAGTKVGGTAIVYYDIGNFRQAPLYASAEIEIVPVPTKAKIELLIRSPFGSSSGNIWNGSTIKYKTSQFEELGQEWLNRYRIQKGTSFPLVKTNNVQARQPLYVRVTDISQNTNPDAIEEIKVHLVLNEAGGFEPQSVKKNNVRKSAEAVVPQEIAFDMRLRETGKNTGIFLGIIPFAQTVEEALNSSFLLPPVRNATLVAQYQDIYDETDTVDINVLVDPMGKLFNSITGEPVSDVSVTLINDATGQPAVVYSDDGLSTYPSTVRSGQSVTDSSGTTYTYSAGEYRFPLVAQGRYRLQLGDVSGYMHPSTQSETAIGTLPNQPYHINDGSWGRPFIVDDSSPTIFVDVPLDPDQALTINKRATKDVVTAGEGVFYHIDIENGSKFPTGELTLTDRMPSFFRLEPQSLRLNGQVVSKETLKFSQKGNEFTVKFSNIPEGQRAVLTYGVRVPVQTPVGEYNNHAQLRGGPGFVSNVATSTVRVEADAINTHGFILGKVDASGCGKEYDALSENQKKISGVPEARIYMSDGTYVIADANGLFRIEGVNPGRHAVQLDKMSLPEGHKIVLCKDSPRHAGSEQTQFVDVRGGQISRLNFHVERTPKAEKEALAVYKKKQKEDEDENKKAKKDVLVKESGLQILYGADWLNKQPDGAFVVAYPTDEDATLGASADFGVVHPAEWTVKAFINEQPVGSLYYEGRVFSKNQKNAISHWKGVSTQKEENILKVIAYDKDGKEVGKLYKELPFLNEAYRAEAVPDDDNMTLIADGRTTPTLRVKVLDIKGRPLYKNAQVGVKIAPPYGTQSGKRAIDEQPLSSSQGAISQEMANVGEKGILEIKIAPTTKSGRVTYYVKTVQGEQEFTAWIKPEKRDWIMVGIADGTIAHGTILKNMQNNKLSEQDNGMMSDGKVAFFTKGMISGEWLLTLALDTEKNEDQDRRRRQVFDQIDPNAYYTVYGDASKQDSETSSQYPLYVKLEKDQFYALFGDYDTEMSANQLMAYSRRLSGFKTLYEGEQLSVLAFAAQTDQSYYTDELKSIGTTGPYRLSSGQVIANSENLVIQTRDRFDRSLILEETTLTRFIDYDIDYTRGVITFRNPVDATDDRFNPKYLVINYEVLSNGQKRWTYGGRVGAKFWGGDFEVGVSHIHDGGGDTLNTGIGGLKATNTTGVDVTIKPFENTQIDLEVAKTAGAEKQVTRNDVIAGTTDLKAKDRDGMAYRAEVVHRSDDVAARAYYQRQNAGFGVGNQASLSQGTERIGSEVRYVVSDTTSKKDEEKSLLPSGRLSAYLKTDRNKDLSGRGQQSNSEVGLEQLGDDYSFLVGFRRIQEDVDFSYNTPTQKKDVKSKGTLDEIIIGGELEPFDFLKLRAYQELPLTDDVSTLYGKRTTFGATAQVMKGVTVDANHEIADLRGEETHSTTVGLNLKPFQDTTVRLAGDQFINQSSENLAGSLGVQQRVRLTDNLSMTLNAQRREVQRKNGIGDDLLDAPDTTLPSFLRDGTTSSPYGYGEDRREGYTLGSMGVAYYERRWGISGLIEFRDGEIEQRWSGTLGITGELTDDLAVAAAFSYRNAKYANTELADYIKGRDGSQTLNELQQQEQLGYGSSLFLRDATAIEGRLGFAYRPKDMEGTIVLDRLDVVHQESGGGIGLTKIVNNLALNTKITPELEFTINHGLKYVSDEMFDASLSNFSHFVGSSVRYDLDEHWEIGGQAMARYGVQTGTLDYAVGPFVGYSPAQNVLITAGYNFVGFRDKDFRPAGFSDQGPYLNLSLKFDQDSLREYANYFISE